MKHLKVFTICLLTLTFLLIPFNIFADSSYLLMTPDSCFIPGRYHSSSSTTWYYYKFSVSNNNDVRFVLINGGSYYRPYFISKEPFSFYESYSYSASCPTNISYNNANSFSLDSNTYYYASATGWTNNSIIEYYVNVENFKYDNLYGNESNSQLKTAIYYTYGDGLIEDKPIPNYGDILIDYRCDYFTAGDGAMNEDILHWKLYDSRGNDIEPLNIEIQAQAGYFTADTLDKLKGTTFENWLESSHPAVTLYKGDTRKQEQIYQWQYVAGMFTSIPTLGTWFWNIFVDEGDYIQYGWRYRARLLDENFEPLTDWQVIYTGNSFNPQATEIFTDDEPLTPDDVETINDINELNNTTNNWYINNTVINNNEYNQTYQQNVIQNIYNSITGTPDDDIRKQAGDFETTVNNSLNQEDNYINDLDTQLKDIDTETPLEILNTDPVINSFRWIREVHKQTVENTHLGTITVVVMLIGLAVYLIGRRNG